MCLYLSCSISPSVNLSLILPTLPLSVSPPLCIYFHVSFSVSKSLWLSLSPFPHLSWSLADQARPSARASVVGARRRAPASRRARRPVTAPDAFRRGHGWRGAQSPAPPAASQCRAQSRRILPDRHGPGRTCMQTTAQIRKSEARTAPPRKRTHIHTRACIRTPIRVAHCSWPRAGHTAAGGQPPAEGTQYSASSK